MCVFICVLALVCKFMPIEPAVLPVNNRASVLDVMIAMQISCGMKECLWVFVY